MLGFVALSYALAVATTALAGLHLVRRPWLALKPSMLVLLLYHLLIQWPAAVASPWIWSFLISPWDALILVHGFVLGGMALSVYFHRGVCEELWRRPAMGDRGVPRIALVSLIAPIALAVVVYLRFVPLASTGLYAMTVAAHATMSPLPAATSAPVTTAVASTAAPPEAPKTPAPAVAASNNDARETSLKSTASPIAYAYFFNAKGLSLVLASLLTLWWLRQKRDLLRSAGYVVSIAALTIGASLSGARSFGVYILLAALITALIDRRHAFRARPIWILLAAFAALLLPLWPALLSVLREGEEITASRLLEYAIAFVTDRLGTGMVPNAIFYLHYTQGHGVLALSALPAVAKFVGSTSINLPNVIQVTYYPSYPSTGFANAGFPFVYYAYLGTASVLVSIVLIQLLDLLLYVGVRIPAPFSTSFVVAVLVNSIALIEAEFTTALITHGILPAAALVVGVAWLSRRWSDRNKQFRSDRQGASAAM